jgi:hypothetical protein
MTQVIADNLPSHTISIASIVPIPIAPINKTPKHLKAQFKNVAKAFKVFGCFLERA